jgi:type IV pilus assembly protein PilO
MEKFLRLPLYQRLAIVAALLAVIAGGYYFLIIAEFVDQAAAEEGKTQRIQQELTGLAAYQDKEKREKLQTEFEEEQKKIEENKKMLPSDEEIPSFLISIKADADLAGLEILKFETKEAALEDYYKRIPVEMEVRGNFHQQVKFFKTLAAPRKRIVNITDLDIERPPLNLKELKRIVGISNLKAQEDFQIEARKTKAKGERETVAQVRAKWFAEWEEARKMEVFKARFTANTFSYTGTPVPEADRAKRAKTGRQRQRR